MIDYNIVDRRAPEAADADASPPTQYGQSPYSDSGFRRV